MDIGKVAAEVEEVNEPKKSEEIKERLTQIKNDLGDLKDSVKT